LTAYTREPARELMPKAKEAALKALELDEKLAEAHASLGQIAAYYDYDFVTAEREYRRALELNPNYATAHQWLAEHLSAMKRFDEALAEIRRALELDPLSLIINRIYADILLDARRYDEAIAQYRKTIELEPSSMLPHYFLARAFEAKGNYEGAVREYGEAAKLNGVAPETVAKVNDVYAKSGWKPYLQAGLKEVVFASGRTTPPFAVATYYARLGDKEQTFSWLQQSYDQRDFRLTLLSVAFEFDEMRSDPRFKELVRRIGLPE